MAQIFLMTAFLLALQIGNTMNSLSYEISTPYKQGEVLKFQDFEVELLRSERTDSQTRDTFQIRFKDDLGQSKQMERTFSYGYPGGLVEMPFAVGRRRFFSVTCDLGALVVRSVQQFLDTTVKPPAVRTVAEYNTPVDWQGILHFPEFDLLPITQVNPNAKKATESDRKANFEKLLEPYHKAGITLDKKTESHLKKAAEWSSDPTVAFSVIINDKKAIGEVRGGKGQFSINGQEYLLTFPNPVEFEFPNSKMELKPGQQIVVARKGQ